MKTVLLDVDGVVADCQTAMHLLAVSVTGRDLPAPPFTTYATDRALGLSESEAELSWSEARVCDWSSGIALYPDAINGVAALMQVAEVVFCTAPWEGNLQWVERRRRLLRSAFPDCEIVSTHSKNRIVGDFLVDDKPETLRHGGQWRGLLWHDLHNADVNIYDVVRVYGWDDVIREVTR